MKILGVNKAATCGGKVLRNGGAAAYLDGGFTAIAEERVTGVKYAAGFTSALGALMEAHSLTLTDFDEIAISTCCETERKALEGHELSGDARLRTVNHHLSHAALAFYASGFERSLVAVVDGGGNVLETPGRQSMDWWGCHREQHSYYVATRQHGLELIGRDFSDPFSVGLGEMYRAFTYYLGWHSSAHGAKTMALSGHGRRSAIKADLYEFEGGLPKSLIRNNPPDPIGMIIELGKVLDVDLGEPRQPGGAILQIHKDVAAFIQEQSEKVLSERLSVLCKQVRAESLCIAGGFALNVVANGKMLDLFPGGVYVPSAPGDEGQSLGNVYARLALRRKEGKQMPTITRSSEAFLGPKGRLDSQEVAAALAERDCKSYIVFETTDFSDIVAQMLSSGAAICLYQERAEFGPRALGSRSILADPRRADAVSRLNNLKSREWFMPFAPAVLAEKMDDWFKRRGVSSPFMSFAVDSTPRAVQELPAIVNADGSSRVQTLEPEDASPLRVILERFEERTGIPVLLNTSFNLGGQPIVETISQAIQSFSLMPVNALAVGRFVVVKSLSPDFADVPLSSSIKDLDFEVYARAGEPPASVPEDKPRAMIRKLQSLTGLVIFVRTELPLYGEYLQWLREGRKVTTIRLRKGAVEVPVSTELPLYETRDFGPGDRSRPTEHVRVSGLRYHRFGELSATDAKLDGFRSYQDMRDALTKIYPKISDEDWVTVYDISLC